MTNSADPDHLASSLFAKTGHVVISKRRVKFSVLLIVVDGNFNPFIPSGRFFLNNSDWSMFNRIGV